MLKRLSPVNDDAAAQETKRKLDIKRIFAADSWPHVEDMHTFSCGIADEHRLAIYAYLARRKSGGGRERCISEKDDVAQIGHVAGVGRAAVFSRSSNFGGSGTGP